MNDLDASLDWTDDGQPRSRRFGDVYFSAEDGLAEARAVFLQGCGLPGAWTSRRRFTVGELGFGTGLNIVALLDLWRATAPPGGHLHIFSVEAFPLRADEAARALGRWPDLAQVAEQLIARWPGRARGRHRIDFPEFAATLDVAIMDVIPALEAWLGRADAWFLDGFSPASNPGMWTDEVLGLVAARTAPAGRVATFTVAGHVRRGLAGAGLAVEKRPGHGRKRQRLEALSPGVVAEPSARRIAIIGGGIAGAAAARAVRALGGEALVIEACQAGAGGSGNPAALVTPRLDAGLGVAAQLYAEAYRRATALYAATPGAVLARGALKLETGPRDRERFARIAAADIFEPGDLTLLGADLMGQRLGEPSAPGLDQAGALVVAPAPILGVWLGQVMPGEVAKLEHGPHGWRVLNRDGALIALADAVIVTAALATRDLVPGTDLRAVRGQASWTRDGAAAPAAAWSGYVLPTGSGVLFGATHDRDDEASDVRDGDHARNRQTLASALPRLAQRLAGSPLEGRAAVRAVTGDMAPLAGPAGPEGLYVLTGFGSRGFSLAPLLAEHVAALALGAPSPIGSAAADLVAPGRFARRMARRV